jgi:sialate O-acetylesterase
MFGYDGPFVMWIDGQRVWCDPKGTNPIVADRHSVTLKASKGEHRIVVSMCTNTGLAWGFCLRAERLDVPVAAFRRGPSAYAMPGFSAT